jgi:adenylate kinase family enzyme
MPGENRPEQEFYFLNVESKHIYKVVRNDDEHVFLERVFKYIPEIERHRAGDGFAVRVGYNGFRNNYTPVDPRTVARIRTQVQEQAAAPIEPGAEGAGADPAALESGGILYQPTDQDDFDRLILDPKIIETIMTGVKKIEMREELENVWGLGDIRPMKNKLALNFYGAPGTGKTASARALAKKLGKPILQVDYASMISKWVGDTAKHIRAAFKDAEKAGAMLFFDEADSVLSKRVEHTGEAYENSVNQNRNVLMQELDRFNNVVIFATNFFKNYDEALLRRIAQHVEFKLPNESDRVKILEKKVPAKARENGKVDESVNLPALAKVADGFSGSDLENTVANAIEFCATNAKKLDQDTLMGELKKIKGAKSAHGGKKGSHYQSHRIGFGAGQFGMGEKEADTQEAVAEEKKHEGREA